LQLRHQLGFVLRPWKDARQVRHVYRLFRLRAPSVNRGSFLDTARRTPCALRNSRP
jgi:hypothetical protein